MSWNEAAEMKLSVSREALVMPSRAGMAAAGRLPSAMDFSLTSWKVCFSTCSPQRNSVSPGSVIRTLRSIWRTMISMCLSLISTPWSRYTC